MKREVDKNKEKNTIEELEKYKLMVETSPDCIKIFDLNNKIEYMSPGGLQEHSFKSIKEAKGKNWVSTVDPSQKPFVLEKIKECINKKKTISFDIKHTKKGSNREWCSLVLKPIIENGKVKKFIGISRDISELKKNQEKYKILYESSSDAIMTLSPPSRNFTAGNPSTIKLFNCKNEKEFTSQNPRNLSPQKQPDGELSSSKAKKMIEMAMKRGSHFFEWTHKTIDGKEFPTTVLLTKMKIENLTQLQATVRDITLYKTSDMEIKKLSLIIEQSPSLVILTDNNGKILYVNKKFTDVTGYFLKEVKGKTPRILKSGNTSDETYKSLWKTVLSGKVWKGNFHNKKKNGEYYWASAEIFPIKNFYGKIINLVGIQQDISEKVKSDEEVKFKIAELEKFQNLTIDRELAMIELKKEVNELKKKLSLPNKYDI